MLMVEKNISVLLLTERCVCLSSVRTKRRDRGLVKPGLSASSTLQAAWALHFPPPTRLPSRRVCSRPSLTQYSPSPLDLISSHTRRNLLVALLIPDRLDDQHWTPPLIRPANVFAHHRLLRTGPEKQGKLATISMRRVDAMRAKMSTSHTELDLRICTTLLATMR